MSQSIAFYVNIVQKYLDAYCKSKQSKYHMILMTLKSLVTERKNINEISNFVKTNEVVLFPTPVSAVSQKRKRVSEVASKSESELEELIQASLRCYDQALKNIRTEIISKILIRSKKSQNGPYSDIIFSHVSKLGGVDTVFHVAEHRNAPNHVGQNDNQLKMIIIYEVCNLILS